MVNRFITNEEELTNLIKRNKINEGDSIEIDGYISKKDVILVGHNCIEASGCNLRIKYSVKGNQLSAIPFYG